MSVEEKKNRSLGLGSYLRKLRSQRRLSLTRIEELSLAFEDRIKPSYLSKIETGKFIPALPKLITLSKIYDVKIQSLVELLDLEEVVATDLTGYTYEELKQIAIQEEQAGNIKKALAYFEASFDLTQLTNKEKALDAELDIAIALRNLGKLELARAKIEEILLRSYGNKNVTARAYIELSSIYRKQGHYPLALVSINEAENIAAFLKNLKLETYILHSKANILNELNEIDEAIRYYERAEKAYSFLENNIEKCRILSNKAIALLKKENYVEVFKLLEEGLKMAYQYNFKKLEAIILSNLAYCYYKTNKIKKAYKYFAQSNNISRKNDYYNTLFINYFYLMKISEKTNDTSSVNQYKRSLRSFLPRIEGSFQELKEFKSSLEQMSTKDEE